MKFLVKSGIFAGNKRNARLLFIGAFLSFIVGCAGNVVKPQKPVAVPDPKYNVDSLAKDWRAQVRKAPNNPYEGGYPADNDSEYSKPKKKKKVSPVDNNEDSNYGKFPRYNADDDNMYLDPKHYPLYFDN